MRPSLKVLAIPDLHCPFQHVDSFDFLDALNRKQKPDVVVCLGDEIDAHALSEYDHDPDGMSAGDEWRAAVKALQTLYAMFPEVKVCTSNHTERPYRKAFKAGIPRGMLRDYSDWLSAPRGWQWKDRWHVDGVAYEHGDPFSGNDGAMQAATANMCPTVIGHIHTFAGIDFLSNRAALIWAMNCGWLGDQDAYSAAYGKKAKRRGILGAGIINRAVPTLIPMLLDRRGRWTGQL